MKVSSIKNNSDFKRAYFRGNKKSSRSLTMYVRRVFCSKIQLGITATKKVGCAVQRNRARRIVKEAFRILNVNCVNYHIVIVAHQNIVHLKMDDIKKEISYLLNYFNFKQKET